MPAGHQDSLQQRLEKGYACLQQLCPPSERTRRATVAVDAVQRLLEYRKYLASLEGETENCAGLRGQLADRAFETESTLRVAIAESLRSLNDLRDSGLLHAQMADFAARVGPEERDLAGMLPQTNRETSEEAVAFPDELHEEMHAMVKRHNLRVRYDAESDVLEVRGLSAAGGAPVATRVRLSPQPGDLGRIGVDEFFGAGGNRGFHPSGPIPLPPDCHHQSNRGATDQPHSVDAYSGLLGCMAAARESTYRHARKVSEYGQGRMTVRAADPFTVSLIGTTVYLVSSFVYAVTGSPTANAIVGVTSYAFVAFITFVVLGIIIVLSLVL